MTPNWRHGGSVADRLQGRVAVQRGLGALEKWADMDLIKFNKDKCEVFNMGWKSSLPS